MMLRESLMCARGTRGGGWSWPDAWQRHRSLRHRRVRLICRPTRKRGPEPFAAHYVAEWRDISVGTSDLQLERDAQPGQYHYK